MAKILYSLCGEGSGHSSRSKVVIEHLIEKGHQVKVISYDRGYENLKPYFDIEKIYGLGFFYRNNEVKYLPTLFENLTKSPKIIKSIEKVEKIFKEFQPQIVFSDFEPICAATAHKKKIPLISIDNQHFLTGTKVEYPQKYEAEALTAKTVTELLVPKADAYLAITFVDAPIKNKKFSLFPPIVRNEVLKLKPANNDFVLIYLTSKFGGLHDILKKINKNFVPYGHGFEEEKREGNLIYKKPSADGFLRDLASCDGLVANAGFSLISEALYLGKPYLAIPVKNQFEQVLNAYYIEKMGYGKFWEKLDREKIEAFLFNLESYRNNLKKYPKENNSKIFTEIDGLVKKYT